MFQKYTGKFHDVSKNVGILSGPVITEIFVPIMKSRCHDCHNGVS